jgi:hypothetical protein
VAELKRSVYIGLFAVPAAADPGAGWVTRAVGGRGTVMESHALIDLVATLVG